MVHILQAGDEDSEATEYVTVRNKDAFLLTQWLEKGVFEAIEKGYLGQMKFAIFTKHQKSGLDLLLETYDFKMSYPTSADPLSRTTINGKPPTLSLLCTPPTLTSHS